MSSQGKSQYSNACVGGCGFFGNPEMQNYCSVCFKKFVPNAETVLKENTQNNNVVKEDKPKDEIINVNNNNKDKDHNKEDNVTNDNNNNVDNKDANNDNVNVTNDNNSNNEKPKKKIRCNVCNKKLALAQQFECKCGQMFCSIHRYADCHNCTFDYQKIQQKKLESLNPVVAPSKVQQL